MSEEKLEWSALEYEEKERSSDWFWALGIIVVTSSLTAIIYSSFFFAALIILSGVLLGFFAKKKPDIVSYELNKDGLRVRTRIYLYPNIKSFWVQVEPTPVLFIKSERFFMPVISIPLPPDLPAEVHDVFVFQNIPEEEMKAHPSEHIMESLGF